MARKRERSPLISSTSDVYYSSKIKEQNSAFVGAFSPILPVKTIQRLPAFQTATLRIAAWRQPSKQRSLTPSSKALHDVGHDDDGEKYAGSKLRQVLIEADVEGVIVVARWYGGQNIGPIRFRHIETCAKQAIWNWKTANNSQHNEEVAKKQKHDENARSLLVNDLRARDDNISVLRQLLADKNSELDDTHRSPVTPQKALPDYSKMPLANLQKLDKARDASIAFILKQIDKVDEQLRLIQEFEETATGFDPS